MEDREAIRELRARYAKHVIRGEGNGAGALFTEDGYFEAGAATVSGREELKKFLARSLTPGKSIPLIVNEIVYIKGDDARGSCTMYTPWYRHEAPGFCGDYEDVFRRVDGRWYFVSRIYSFHEGKPAEV